MTGSKSIQHLTCLIIFVMFAGSLQMPGAQQLGTPDSQMVEALVRQLGERTFSRRQLASEELWRLGPAVGRYLEPHRNHLDPEVANRVSTILAALDLGLDAATPYPIARLVLDFENREIQVQNQVLNNLRNQGRFLMLLELISKLDDAQRKRTIFQDFFSTYSIIERLALQGNWDEVRQIVSHPVTWEYSPEICLFWMQLNGGLAEQIETLKAEVLQDFEQLTGADNGAPESASEAGSESNPDGGGGMDFDEEEKKSREASVQSKLQLLIRMLRIADRREEALEFALKLSDERNRSAIRNWLWMEMGDWKRVSDNLIDPEKKPDFQKDQLPSSLSQQLTVHYFANFPERVQGCLEKLRQEHEKAKLKGEDEDFIIGSQHRLANAYLFLQDWENASQWIDANRTDLHFDILIYLNRIDEAFQVVGLPDNLPGRSEWFERLLRRVDSIDKQFKRSENDRFEEKSRWLFQLGVKVAVQLGSLGFVDEAQLHLRTLADSLNKESLNSIEKRSLILDAMIKLECYEGVRELIQDRFTDAEIPGIVSYLFPNRSETLRYWQSRLRRIYTEKESLLRRLNRLTSSPVFQYESDFDLSEIFSIAEQDARTNAGLFNYHLSKFNLYAGDFRTANMYLRRSAELGYLSASEELALNANLVGDYRQVIELTDQAWRTSQNTIACALLAEAYRQTGELEAAKNFQLLAFARWKDVYRASEVAGRFFAEDQMQLLEPLLNVVVHGTNSAGLINENFRDSLASSQLKSDPVSAFRNRQIGFLRRWTNPDWVPTSVRLNDIQQFRIMEMLASAKLGDLPRIQSLVASHENFHKGDADVGRQLLPLLKEQGHDELAFSIMNQLSESYFDILLKYPESSTQNNNYAWLLATSGYRLEFAKRHAEIAVNRQPNNSSFLDTLAEVAFLTGDREGAVQLNKRCIQLNPVKRNYWKQYFRFGQSKPE